MISLSSSSCHACYYSEDDCSPSGCTIINFAMFALWIFACIILILKAPFFIIHTLKQNSQLSENKKIYFKKKQTFFTLAATICLLGFLKSLFIVNPISIKEVNAFHIIDLLSHLFTVITLSLYIIIIISWIEILESHSTLGLNELRHGFMAFGIFIIVGILASIACFVCLIYFPSLYLQFYYVFTITAAVIYSFLLIMYLLYGVRLFNTLNEVGIITYNATLKERINNARKPIKILLKKVSFYVIISSITLLTITASLIVPSIVNRYLEKQVFLAVLYPVSVFTYCMLVFFGLASYRQRKDSSLNDNNYNSRNSFESYGTHTYASSYDRTVELSDESTSSDMLPVNFNNNEPEIITNKS